MRIDIRPTDGDSPAGGPRSGGRERHVGVLLDGFAARTQQRREDVHRRHLHTLACDELVERRHRDSAEQHQDDDHGKQLDQREAAASPVVTRRRPRDATQKVMS